MALAARKITASESLFERITHLADRLSGYRLGEYAASSGYVRQSASPFDGFGAVVAAGSRPLPIVHSLREVAAFTVEEARERLAAFIDGRFVPDSLADLIEYFGERFLRIEARISPTGGVTNYIVDAKTNQAVPAAQVDPRLSHSAMLAAQLRGALRQQIGTSSPAEAFDSWQGMMLVMDNSPSGVGYTVSGGEAWFGKVHAVASADPEKNLAIVRAARNQGVELVLPRRAEGEGLVAGMPILVRSRSMKAAAVHPGLAHDRLSLAFGKGMAETFDRLGEKSRRAGGPRAAEDKVVSMEAFRQKFVRRKAQFEERPEEDGGLGFGGLAGSARVRDLVIRRSSTEDLQLYVFDRDLGEEVPIAPSSLPAGRYVRETAVGVKEGYTEVGPGGAMRHSDLEGRRVKLSRTRSEDLDESLGERNVSVPRR